MRQEIIAFGIVGLTVGVLGVHVYRVYLATPLSKWMLKRGKVKAAMRVRKQALAKPGCSNCKA
jgi:hypothetical protein